MTDTTPKACPFCGGEANTEIRHSRIDGVKDRHFPSCLNGDCPAFIVEPYVTYSTKREALTAWNTRANADARLMEALRGLAGNAGALKAFEWEIREVCGNTNWQCLMDAIAKAGAALSEVNRG